jgi:hypothetical protein
MTEVTKLFTNKRSIFFVAFLALALVGTATILRLSPVRGMAQNPTLNQGDLAYVDSNLTFSTTSGSYDGRQVTFRLGKASGTATKVTNGPAAAGVDFRMAAACSEEGLDAGAAADSQVAINTSGYSLPLQYDAYLPVSITGIYNGTDVGVQFSITGTVLAYAGFSAANPTFAMTDSGVGIDVQPALLGSKDSSYRLAVSKSSLGSPSITGGKVTRWKSNVAKTEDITQVGVFIDKSVMQYDAASRTLNVRQSFHLKSVKGA